MLPGKVPFVEAPAKVQHTHQKSDSNSADFTTLFDILLITIYTKRTDRRK